MNGSTACDLTLTPASGPMLNVQRYCQVKKVLRAARKEAMKSLGMTQKDLEELEIMAKVELEMSGEPEVETEHGVAYLQETPAFIHKNSQPFSQVVKLMWHE
jgi:hypothetical protein